MFSYASKEKFEVEIHIMARFGESFIIFLVVLYLVHIKKWTTQILH